MNPEENFQLDTWKGDWGLSSVDTHCLQVLVSNGNEVRFSMELHCKKNIYTFFFFQAYAKFCGVPLKVNPTCDPFRTPNGRLPVLRHGVKRLDSIQDIIDLFRQKNYSLEYNLSPKQCAEVMAYDHMLKDKLYPALQFIWCFDEYFLFS